MNDQKKNSDGEQLSVDDKLRIAGYSAPRLRHGTPRRNIKIVNSSGSVTGETDTLVLARKILARADIEFDVEQPRYGKCAECGLPCSLLGMRMAMVKRKYIYCSRCKRDRCVVCKRHVSPAKAHLARKRNGNAYCDEHKYYSRNNKTNHVVTCAVCGKRLSKNQEKYCGRKCLVKGAAKTRSSRVPKITCHICDTVVPHKRAVRAARVGGKAFCAKHTGGRLMNRPEASIRCAGFAGNLCPDKAMPTRSAITASAVKRRLGRAWRCNRCAARSRSGQEYTTG